MVHNWYEYSEFTGNLANDREAAERYISVAEGQRTEISRRILYYTLAVAIFCQVRDRRPRSIAENSDKAVGPPNIKAVLVKVHNAFWSREYITLILFS